MASVDDRIEALTAKLKQAKAQKQQQEARKRAAESKKKRADDTRKKVLVGAVILAKAENDADYKARLFQTLGQKLIRDDDRALFGLQPLP